ncbi:MAG: hypothetical protein Tsb0021_02240 [Chlamydiales bacterium]
MRKTLHLFIFIDAFGWELYRRNSFFLDNLIVDKKPLETIFGYSSACDPSIISGQPPSVHGMWSSYYYSPSTSPFESLKWLEWLPHRLTNSHCVRHHLSRLVAKWYGFTGYFQLYQVPFRDLPLFDYAEKKWMWGTKNGLLKGTSIFDHLIEHRIPFYAKPSVSISEEEQCQQAIKKIKNQEVSFVYLMLGKLDGIMHAKGTEAPETKDILKYYDQSIRDLIQQSEFHYDTVHWYVFSDHGMHNIKTCHNLQKEIEQLNLNYGKDYVAFYDATMARFWFLSPQAETTVRSFLAHHTMGNIIKKETLQEFETYFSDQQYGELIFLMKPGILIVPSFMGRSPLKGMHGYHPQDPDSKAMICSNQSIPNSIKRIQDIYHLMQQELQN